MKYYKFLPDGRLKRVSRTTFWRLCHTSGFVREELDDLGYHIGWIFIPE